MRRHLPTVAAALAVVAAYTFFASNGTWSFRRLQWHGTSLYASLGEGFLRGQLNVAIEPEPRLTQLSNPYDFELRNREKVEYLWDASYYNGKYYIYFSPLPVLMFYIPFRLVGGGYPPDSLVGLVFSVWAFVMAVLFARRALPSTRVPFPVWVLLIGLGNLVPYVLASVRTYEVCVAVSMAMTATWAYALLRFTETRFIKHAVWVGFWLAMAIVARPNLIVLLLIAAFAITGLRNRLAALAPLAVIGLIAAWYNWARFGNPLELGVSYQLTGLDLRHYSVCSLCNVPELLRWFNNLVHYVFWAPTIATTFPFVDLSPIRLDPAMAYPGFEGMGGIVPILPLAGLATFFLFIVRGGAATRVMLAAWLIVAGLSACWYVVGRYSLDFIVLMAMSTVVLVELGLAQLSGRGLRVLVIALACWSIVIGFFLGFQGNENRWRMMNPDLFRELSEDFNPHERGRDMSRPRPRD